MNFDFQSTQPGALERLPKHLMRAARVDDLHWMVALHEANTRAQVANLRNGFVNPCGDTVAQMLEWVTSGQAWVAVDAASDATNQVRGLAFAICQPPPRTPPANYSADELSATSPILQYLIDNERALLLRSEPLRNWKWYVYGPAVVAEQVRGAGLASALYRHVAREQISLHRVQALVTYIDVANEAATQMHQAKLRMQTLSRVGVKGRKYLVLGQTIRLQS